jgi:hypothetical protein
VELVVRAFGGSAECGEAFGGSAEKETALNKALKKQYGHDLSECPDTGPGTAAASGRRFGSHV